MAINKTPWLVVGLGNPGPEYQYTRHNAGFLAIDSWSKQAGFQLTKGRFGFIVRHEDLIILKPQTFMNLSGEAVGPAQTYYRIPTQHVIVIHDDLDIATGSVRIRVGGSSGGHNGIKSIISCVEGNQFVRVRIGIARPPAPMKVIDWVLGRFSAQETEKITPIWSHTGEIVRDIVDHSPEFAMNRYNGSKERRD